MRVVIGFVPLLDCATLVAAATQGFAAAEGLELALIRETSWANIRDRVLVGHFDAAHMLAPMAIASSLGIGHLKVPMLAPISLGLGGNAITLSASLWEEVEREGGSLNAPPATQGMALHRVLTRRRARGEAPVTLAMVYPFSAHNYELRYWLAACGIHPDQDVRLVVLPPPLLVDAMREGQIDGFCVGEPWSSLAVESGVGRIVTTSTDIWRASPEKVLGMRVSWAEQHPDTLSALVRAVYHAANWCDDPANHAQLAHVLAQPQYVGASAEVLSRGLSGKLLRAPGIDATTTNEFLVFAKRAATFPWRTHALWFYSQMVRWRQIAASDASAQSAAQCYRPDLYRAALSGVPADIPAADMKLEEFGEAVSVASTSGSLSLGHQGFFDKRTFDPQQLSRYVTSFSEST
jgi:two-component system, oxyanion-binding sensor